MRFEDAYAGWSVKHAQAWYRRGGGTRSDGWVKQILQAAGDIVADERHAGPRSGIQKKNGKGKNPGFPIKDVGNDGEGCVRK